MPAMVSRETVELAALAYLGVGTLIWCFVLIPTGAVAGGFDRWSSVSLFFGFRASLAAILVWPRYAWITWRRRKEVGVLLKRAWGVRR